MLFSSLIFLYAFLPAVLLLVFISKRSWHNGILLAASLLFFAWGGVSFSLLLLGSILVNYTCGLLIEKFRGTAKAKRALALGVGLNLLLLATFKYANFIVDNVNKGLAALGVSPIELDPIPLPLGISFFTFQAISYIVDVYQDRSFVQKKLHNLALYISLFPQLIAGPIVRYHDIARQISQRQLSWKQCSSGIERFILGLGKKVLLANNFALLADEVFALAPERLDILTAWVGIIAYTLQLYFDFSGYSDMAIGLGRMFGFNIPENFNFPYISRSIREFWRRWHISLSTWFRDYLYYPLGGSRRSRGRTYFNLILVFFLTGLWHGAAWTFVLFGLSHGFFMILERIGLERYLHKRWKPIPHIYTMGVIFFSFIIFRSESISEAMRYWVALLGRAPEGDFRFDLAFYFNYELIIAFIIGILASTPLFKSLHEALTAWFDTKRQARLSEAYGLISTAGLLLIFLYCTMNLVTSSYNPFIYFRF